MPSLRGRYYLGRVIKLPATFSQAQFLESLRRPTEIYVGAHGWTITSFQSVQRDGSVEYVFGKLTKFKPDGTVNVVDTERYSEVALHERNLSVAVSPFVYIPKYSGIAYLHRWNFITSGTFRDRFTKIVETTNNSFFVECHVELISDFRTFAQKLSTLDHVEALDSKIYPPNPLFGPLWDSLRRYLQERKATEMHLEERAVDGEALATNLAGIVQSILDGKPSPIPTDQIPIGDAAILMAADGYGVGKVIGKQDANTIVVRTSDTVKSFLFAKEPDPTALYEAAAKAFEAVNLERDLKH